MSLFGSRPGLMLALCFSAASLPAVSAQEAATTFALPDSTVSVNCTQQLQSENHHAAVSAANLALARDETNTSPDLRFAHLVCRGRAYAALAETKSAERDFREALRLAGRHFDPFDVRLVDPLTHLGRLRLAAEDNVEAELLLLQARDITHRNAGIFNIEQEELLDDLTEVFMQQGRSQQANRQQQLRLRSARETYGETPELIESLHDFAKWNSLKQDYPKVRVAIDEAVAILEEAYGANDPRLIPTLRLRAQLYKLNTIQDTPKAGIKAMQRVVDIYSAQEFVDQADLLKARTDMGDWYLQSLKFRRALRYYKKAVKKSIAENIDPALLDSIYGTPKLIFIDTEKKSFYGRNEAGELLDSGFIRVRYSVAVNGRTRNVRVIEDTLGNAKVTEEVRSRAETAAYRPRYVNGKATATHGIEQRFDINQTGAGLEVGRIHGPIWIK